MKISKDRLQVAYISIHDPIMSLRVDNAGGMTIEEMDERLLKLEQEIWSRLCRSLKIQSK